MATRLREWRAQRKLSQRALAEASGVSREYIARIELGQHDPTVSTLVKLAKALGVKPGGCWSKGRGDRDDRRHLRPQEHRRQRPTDEARSTTRQVERATEYARAKGWTVDPRYVYVDDAVSGAEWKHRPGFNALLAALEPRPPFGVLIVSELSRIGRDTVRTPYAVPQLEEAGVEIHGYLERPPITLADEAGEMRPCCTRSRRSFERRRARQRTYDALRRRAEAGAVTGGRVFGYDNSATATATSAGVIDADEAAVGAPHLRALRRGRRAHPHRQGAQRRARAAPARARARLGADGDPGDAPPPALRGRRRLEPHAEGDARGHQGAAEAPAGRVVSPRGAGAAPSSTSRSGRRCEARRDRAAHDVRPGARGRAGSSAGRPGADLESPYLLSGLAQCGTCGGSLVAMTRSHGPPAGEVLRLPLPPQARRHRLRQRRRAPPGHPRRGRGDAAQRGASARAIEVAVAKALGKLRANRARDLDRRATLDRERAAIETRIAHLGDAIKRGKATDTLLDLLATEETQRKALAREFAGLADLERVAALDAAAVARDIQGIAEETIACSTATRRRSGR